MVTSIKGRVLPPSILGKQLRWFPFSELRSGQTKVLRLLENEPLLALQAPTGFGKSVLALAGIWYRMIWGDRQLYLFAKTKAQLQSVFLRNLKRYYSRPPADQLTILPLIARGDLCSHPTRDSCRGCSAKSRARYFSSHHLTDLLHQLTLGQCPESFQGFRQFLQRYGCPYDLIRRMLPQANIILLTHGYLESLFLREVLERVLFKADGYGFKTAQREIIIDEAHNFGPTVEAVLTREQLKQAFEITSSPLVRSLIQVLDRPLGQVQRPRDVMPDSVQQLDLFLRSRSYLSSKDYDTLLAVRSFVERKADYWVLNEQGLVQLNPWPSMIFAFLRPRFSHILLLSGTFHKFPLYALYYGLNKGGLPFTFYQIGTPRERRRQLLFGAFYHPTISSKPEHRTPEFYSWSAALIHEMALIAGDHTLVFVPSYEALESLYPLVCERLNGQLSTYQEPQSGRIPFLNTLVKGPSSVIVAVYGGKFSEGVEIRQPTTGRSRIRLIVLVGLPFPPPTPEYKLLERLYHRKWGYSFTRWALLERTLYTQVQQCFGRAIRSDQDRAVAIILDYRAITQMYLPGVLVFRTRSQLTDALMFAFFRIKKGL
ncbi:MAG: helicase C-terminal domain-containing protein [Candidatus Hodarchaeota archaeon]